MSRKRVASRLLSSSRVSTTHRDPHYPPLLPPALTFMMIRDVRETRNKTSAKQMASQFASNALMAMKGKLNAYTTSVATLAFPDFEAQTPLTSPPKPLATRLSTSSQNSVSTEMRERSEGDIRTASPGPSASGSLEKEHITARSGVSTGGHNAPTTQPPMGHRIYRS